VPEPIDGGAPAPAEPDRAQLTLSASACAKLRAYAAAVTRRHGSKELAALLLGPADEPRRCTDVFLLRHQIVSAASFDCTARNVQRTISEALESTGLELLGLAHLHPPYAFLCHSSTDDEWISEKLAPHLAALPRFERRWSRALPPTHDGAGSVLPLDDAGLLRVRCPGVELAAAVVEGVQTHDRVFSVVFQVDHERIRLYALELTFTYDPVPGEGGEVRLLSSVTADEPEVVVEPGEPEPIDLDEVDGEVRRYVSTYWGGSRRSTEEEDELDSGWSPREGRRGLPRGRRPARALPEGVTTPRLLERALADVRRALGNGEPAVRERLLAITELLGEAARLSSAPVRAAAERGAP